MNETKEKKSAFIDVSYQDLFKLRKNNV